jgi:hypothetical protein
MSEALRPIESGLSRVRELRAARQVDASLARRVESIKRYQHARLQRDYIAWLADPRYRAAARFFLEQLYGPRDFSARDAQFSRIVPALGRMLPEELRETVVALIELHALTEQMDQAMALCLSADQDLDRSSYRSAWQRVGRPELRARQVELMLQIGRSLDRHTRSALLGATLRLMRAPAHAAGLGDLQEFLESGYQAFRAMKGAEEFLLSIARNERAQIDALFNK